MTQQINGLRDPVFDVAGAPRRESVLVGKQERDLLVLLRSGAVVCRAEGDRLAPLTPQKSVSIRRQDDREGRRLASGRSGGLRGSRWWGSGGGGTPSKARHGLLAERS